MIPVHAQLFNHAVNSLQLYQEQPQKAKDIKLIEDAHVALSCVFNTMSDRVCGHFEKTAQDDGLVDRALSESTIVGFEEHPSTIYMRRYIKTLEEKGVKYLRRKLIVDRGVLHSKHLDAERLPADGNMEDRVLQILSQLEKALETSRIIRDVQSADNEDKSESGWKVNCLFRFDKIALSKIAFSQANIGERDITLQHQKSVRLARCIQRAHAAIGVENPSVLMADMSGM
ncbi:hypothetical protein BGZ54_005754 [Gamsiella multidivaricata]|nr:hypothetical protein BGZ54_005754 [Gamsiella multidivaricata]